MKIKELFSRYKKTIIGVSLLAVIIIVGLVVSILHNSDSNMDNLAANPANMSDDLNPDADALETESPQSTTTPIESEAPATTTSTGESTPITTSEISDKSVLFTFYSSSAQNVYLAGEMNNWSTTANEMTKNGNWFTTSIPLEGNVEYKFVVDGTWTIDPFSIDTKGENANSYLDLAANGNTNIDRNIYAFSSQNFDYFSLKNEDKTAELEGIYSTLKSRLLTFMNPTLKYSKIKYYGIDYTSGSANSWFNVSVPFSMNNTSEVYDLWDCNSSHELVHLLVSVENQFFNEGIAQCFQYEGNMSYKEQNVNLNMSYQLMNNGTTDFMNVLSNSIQTPPSNYYTPASFIYYNVEVLNNDAEFAAFLKSLSYSDNLTSIQNKYQAATNKNMSSVVAEWENWLNTINSSSNIYIQW